MPVKYENVFLWSYLGWTGAPFHFMSVLATLSARRITGTAAKALRQFGNLSNRMMKNSLNEQRGYLTPMELLVGLPLFHR